MNKEGGQTLLFDIPCSLFVFFMGVILNSDS